MKVATAFRDPQSATKLLCDALLAAALERAEPPAYLAGLRIATSLGEAPQTNLLVVTSGIWTDYQPPVLGVNRVRIAAWSIDADAAWDICSWFHGQLLAAPGDEDFRGFRYDAGPRRGVDPEYKSPIAVATLRASMRPAIL
jgi:hypothetical protein